MAAARVLPGQTQGAPNAEAMSTAMGVIEARARFDGVERAVYLRVAEHGNKIYLDLCNDDWSAVEIDADGWRIVDAPPVRFRRTPGMLPLPDPESGGSLDELRKHLHVDDNGYVLAVSWLLASLRARGPYPILTLTGEQGTGKSLTAHMLRSLIDPHTASLRSLPRDTRDLYVVAMNGHVLVFDNLSSMSAEISDCLCRLSTGGGFSTRALYTDNDEVIFDGQRPIALTSITDVANRSDLADRLVIVRLEVIPDEERRPEEELLTAFEAARPRILGALLDAVSHGLMQLPHTRLNRLPRMADYAVWVRACETAIWSGRHAHGCLRGEPRRCGRNRARCRPCRHGAAPAHGGADGNHDDGDRVARRARRSRQRPRAPRPPMAGKCKRALGPANSARPGPAPRWHSTSSTGDRVIRGPV